MFSISIGGVTGGDGRSAVAYDHEGSDENGKLHQRHGMGRDDPVESPSRRLKNSLSLQAAQKAPDAPSGDFQHFYYWKWVARPQGPRRPQRSKNVREDLRWTENDADGLFQQPASG